MMHTACKREKVLSAVCGPCNASGTLSALFSSGPARTASLNMILQTLKVTTSLVHVMA
jgi:hypothetical protein